MTIPFTIGLSATTGEYVVLLRGEPFAGGAFAYENQLRAQLICAGFNLAHAQGGRDEIAAALAEAKS